MKGKMNHPGLKDIHQNKSDEKQVEYVLDDGFGFLVGKTRLRLSEQAIFLCRGMNGRTSDEELRKMFKKRYGVEISEKDFKAFIRNLEKCDLLADKAKGFLMSKLSVSYGDKQLKIFKKKKIREPSYAGICYKSIPEELEKDLKMCFASVDNHKLDTLKRGMGRLRGIVVPHSNIELSGSCAAWAYRAIAKMPMFDLFIILAPDHSTSLINPFSVLPKDFSTPLGLVKTDKDFTRMLAKKCNFDIFTGGPIHIQEHSVEMQLPFLQYIYRKNWKKPKIVPILCAHEPMSIDLNPDFYVQRDQFLQVLQKTINESGKKVVFIATGDLIHKNKARSPTARFHNTNKTIIRLLEKGNAQDFKRGCSWRLKTCGRMSFYSFLRLLEPTRGKVLNYSWTSNSNFIKHKRDIQYERLVEIGYVSMAFY